MKKTLLFAAMAVLGLSMNAESFGDYVKITYNDKEVADGAVIDVTHFEWSKDYGKEFLDKNGNVAFVVKGGAFECLPHLEAMSVEAVDIISTLEFNGNPTSEQFIAADQAGSHIWGTPQLCYGQSGNPGNCVQSTDKYATNVGGGTFEVPETGYGEYQIHLSFSESDPAADFTSSYVMKTVLKDNPTLTHSFTINFKLDNPTPPSTGVNELVGATGAAEYYTLQGVKVANPEKGMYIVKQNGKARKVVR